MPSRKQLNKVIAYISEPMQLAYIVHNFEWRNHSSPVDELFLCYLFSALDIRQQPGDVREFKFKGHTVCFLISSFECE